MQKNVHVVYVSSCHFNEENITSWDAIVYYMTSTKDPFTKSLQPTNIPHIRLPGNGQKFVLYNGIHTKTVKDE